MKFFVSENSVKLQKTSDAIKNQGICCNKLLKDFVRKNSFVTNMLQSQKNPCKFDYFIL